MAKFVMTYPDEIIEDLRNIYDDFDNIVAKMTRAGAEVVYSDICSNVPAGIRDSEMMKCLKITETYKTPTDGGINTKVAFYGYFTNEDGVKTPAPLVANVFEHGASNNPNFPKQPFMRKSFNKRKIEKAMLEVQKEASGGLLDA